MYYYSALTTAILVVAVCHGQSNNVLSTCIDGYLSCLEERPLLTKSITSAVMQGLGDSLAQNFEMYRQGLAAQKASHGKKQQQAAYLLPRQTYDWRRGMSLAADGFLVSGPLLHHAYDILEYLIPSQHETTWLSIATILHVLANDYIIDTMYICLSFTFVAIAEGHLKDLPMLLRKDLLATIKASWGTSMAFLPIEYLCFRGLPLSLRVLAMNFIDIAWGAIISFVAHRNRKKHAA